ncbi:MAG: NAD(P)H-nitrite reductase large subunit [Hyphomicrobiaceae bacterium]|jgi:NAD(P)H-nitrite reductase large subunit
MHHVILGAGPAGVTAAETIRKQDPTAEITLVGGEGEPPYSRMAIPYLLEGKIGEDGTYLRQTKDHYQTHAIKVAQGPVTAVDTAAKSVALKDGNSIAYDKLLIATGASPVRPPIDGLDQPGVHTCWTLEDARHITKLAKKGAPVVLVGAGFIGSIILESLAKAGVKLTVIEMGDRMVPRMLDETAGNMLRRWCEKEGVRVITSTTVEAIKGIGAPTTTQTEAQTQQQAQTASPDSDEQQPGLIKRLFGISSAEPSPSSYPASAAMPAPPTTNDNTPIPPGSSGLSVVLGNGEAIAAELVVVATGVRSNTGFLEGSGIKTGAGITVDDHLATSARDVYAAGDVAEGMDLSTGTHDMLAIQPVAVEHGYLAAMNMTGTPTKHRGSLNMNVLDTLGLISSSFGQWQGVPGGQSVTKTEDDSYRYMRLEFDGDKLIGAQCVGVTEHIGMLRGLIQTGLPLGPWKDRLIESPERLPEAYIATAHGTPGHGPSGLKIALPV